MLNQFEDLIRRDMGEKFCVDCSQLIEGNVANHRIWTCENLTKHRRSIENQEWFKDFGKFDPDSKEATKHLLRLFERPGIFSLIKMMKKGFASEVFLLNK